MTMNEPTEKKHKCWDYISCVCEICGTTGCRDCLDLKIIRDEQTNTELECCLLCYLKEQELNSA